MKKYFFCGIGGIGMSGLAEVLLSTGNKVIGSDRSFDVGKKELLRLSFKEKGIDIFPQDGSGVDKSIDVFVISSAIESNNIDFIKAQSLGINIKSRAEVLSEIFSLHNGIAIGGTSGKTTVTAMTGEILKQTGLFPKIINGGIMLNEGSNVALGTGGFCVIEADESDGSIELYRPSISVVTNISLDHKPIIELKKLFIEFISKATVGAVLNGDCSETRELKKYNDNVITFSLKEEGSDIIARNIRLTEEGSFFEVGDTSFELRVIGRHNIENALASIGVGDMLGISRTISSKALYNYKGVHRRLETVGKAKGITVIDDFAHNPAKIAATLSALKESIGRLWIIYQPHGYAPTRLMKEGLIEVFSSYMDKNDILLLSEIFYAGGSVSADISSEDIAKPLRAKGVKAEVISSRSEILGKIMSEVKRGDRIVVMGARDETLSDFAHTIFQAIEIKYKEGSE